MGRDGTGPWLPQSAAAAAAAAAGRVEVRSEPAFGVAEVGKWKGCSVRLMALSEAVCGPECFLLTCGPRFYRKATFNPWCVPGCFPFLYAMPGGCGLCVAAGWAL